MRHHEAAIAAFVARAARRPDVLGVLVTGSVARGDEREDSDVDLVLVVTEETWHRAVERDRVMYTERDGAGYAGGYFDVKLATTRAISAAADRGDDPVRRSLGEARCAFDSGIGLPAALARIRENRPDRADLVAALVAQARIHGDYFLAEGLRREDPLLTAHAAVHLATSAARALLARHDRAFPGPKQLLDEVRSLPGGTGFAEAVVEVVQHPGPGAARALLDRLDEAVGARSTAEGSLSRFVLDNEFAWFTGRAAPEYR